MDINVDHLWRSLSFRQLLIHGLLAHRLLRCFTRSFVVLLGGQGFHLIFLLLDALNGDLDGDHIFELSTSVFWIRMLIVLFHLYFGAHQYQLEMMRVKEGFRFRYFRYC